MPPVRLWGPWGLLGSGRSHTTPTLARGSWATPGHRGGGQRAPGRASLRDAPDARGGQGPLPSNAPSMARGSLATPRPSRGWPSNPQLAKRVRGLLGPRPNGLDGGSWPCIPCIRRIPCIRCIPKGCKRGTGCKGCKKASQVLGCGGPCPHSVEGLYSILASFQ